MGNQNKTPAPMKIALLIATLATLAVGTYAAVQCKPCSGTTCGTAAACSVGMCMTAEYTPSGGSLTKVSACDTGKMCSTGSIAAGGGKTTTKTGTSCPAWSSAGMTKPSIVVMAVAALFAMTKL